VIVVYRETAGATGCKSRKRPESAARKSEKGYTFLQMFIHTINTHAMQIVSCGHYATSIGARSGFFDYMIQMRYLSTCTCILYIMAVFLVVVIMWLI